MAMPYPVEITRGQNFGEGQVSGKGSKLRIKVILFASNLRHLTRIRVRDGLSGNYHTLTQWSPRPVLGTESEIALAKKFDLRLAEPDEIHRCDRNRTVDAEDSDLELVARFDSIGEHHAIGHVEALDRGRAGVAGAARHLPIDPDFRVIIDVRRKHRRGT